MRPPTVRRDHLLTEDILLTVAWIIRVEMTMVRLPA